MSTNKNTESVINQGEFHAKVPPSEPLTTHGHAPGTKVGNDAASEFHAQTVPAGTAPKDRLFTPQTKNEIPGQANNPSINKDTWTSAQETINGATSQDVHYGFGVPGSGMSSQERHDGSSEKTGLAGRGGSVGTNGVRERGLDLGEGVKKGTKGYSGLDRQDIAGAEEREVVSASGLATERA